MESKLTDGWRSKLTDDWRSKLTDDWRSKVESLAHAVILRAAIVARARRISRGLLEILRTIARRWCSG
jgi:hypothetical protein